MKSSDRNARPDGESLDATVREGDAPRDEKAGSFAEPAPKATNLERRRGPGRRLTDFVRSAEEGEMDREQFLFLLAIDEFKRVNGKAFPNWTDVLEVVRKLGYRKTMPSAINLRGRAQDWSERPDAPVARAAAVASATVAPPSRTCDAA